MKRDLKHIRAFWIVSVYVLPRTHTKSEQHKKQVLDIMKSCFVILTTAFFKGVEDCALVSKYLSVVVCTFPFSKRSTAGKVAASCSLRSSAPTSSAPHCGPAGARSRTRREYARSKRADTRRDTDKTAGSRSLCVHACIHTCIWTRWPFLVCFHMKK